MAVSGKPRGHNESEKKMTPEIFFARKLASNDKKIRDKNLKKLKKWISARSNVPDGNIWGNYMLFPTVLFYFF